MNLILPVAGKSTRYPDVKPKFLLIHPNCTFMFIEAIKGLNLEDFADIYIGCLKEHVKEYNCYDGIKKELRKIFKGTIHIVMLNKQTKSQPETVAEIIKKGKVVGNMAIKDCDNYQEVKCIPDNFVSYCDVSKYYNTDLSNKSYIQIDDSNNLNNIIEKKIISDKFCSGIYGMDAKDYMKYYNRLKGQDGLYISHIVYAMLLDDYRFKIKESENFLDWGTMRDWTEYCQKFVTLFVDIDGVIVKNSSKYFKIRWGNSDPIEKNGNVLKKLYDTERVHIILTTSRSSEFKRKTEDQLEKIGFKYHSILYGLPHCKRIIINDFASTNTYPSCEAINVERDSEILEGILNKYI